MQGSNCGDRGAHRGGNERVIAGAALRKRNSGGSERRAGGGAPGRSGKTRAKREPPPSRLSTSTRPVVDHGGLLHQGQPRPVPRSWW